ncbi:MAG: hypothetical protein K2Q34_02665 [Alphaproteobacteria bacterium]|nr:hypothetical protein [Alphaproteobacteria bacterium]
MKKNLYRLCLILGFSMHFTQLSAMESLVVGCDGASGQLQYYFQKIMGPADCSPHHHMLHIDLRPTASARCPHQRYQQADAKSWNPGSVVLQEVFMELFPSMYVTSAEGLQLMFFRDNPRQFEQTFKKTVAELRAAHNTLKTMLGDQAPSLEEMIEEARQRMSQEPVIDKTLMPDTIKNLACYMSENAVLAIEHLPYIDIRPLTLYPSMAVRINERNPFHLYVSPIFMDLLKVCLADEADKEAVWTGVRERLQQEGITEAQRENLIAEVNTSEALCKSAIANVQALLTEEPFMDILNTDIAVLSQDFPQQKVCFTNSLSAVIAVEFYMLQNQQTSDSGIQKFLADSGFKDIRMERVAENQYNHRKNSWMIFAKRNA